MNKRIDFVKCVSAEDYNYYLPDSKIAKYPLSNRENSKLLVYKNAEICSDTFSNIHNYLPPKSLLIFNNTKVIQARLIFHKVTGAQIEVFCIEPIMPKEYNLVFQQTRNVVWKCVVGNLKKWKNDTIHKNIIIDDIPVLLEARIINKYKEFQEIEFSWDNATFTFGEIIEKAGSTPIPPYLNREAEDSDITRYQTIYSKIPGSVAAPTAGLHFTKDILRKLTDIDIKKENITLHVGAGTFLPVKSETISGHNMHTEYFSVSKNSLECIANYDDKIISVGTTSMRTLESLFWLAVGIKEKSIAIDNNLFLQQWEAYESKGDIDRKEALTILINYLNKNNQSQLHAKTQLLIAPGYQFKMVDGLITNYHQPKSTLLMLVAAFIGDKWKDIYSHALDNDYRFLSYGDSSLLLPDN